MALGVGLLESVEDGGDAGPLTYVWLSSFRHLRDLFITFSTSL